MDGPEDITAARLDAARKVRDAMVPYMTVNPRPMFDDAALARIVGE